MTPQPGITAAHFGRLHSSHETFLKFLYKSSLVISLLAFAGPQTRIAVSFLRYIDSIDPFGTRRRSIWKRAEHLRQPFQPYWTSTVLVRLTSTLLRTAGIGHRTCEKQGTSAASPGRPKPNGCSLRDLRDLRDRAREMAASFLSDERWPPRILFGSWLPEIEFWRRAPCGIFTR